ncbi:MAG: Ig-like domain-containing protein [Lachnospiraceae bacterium]|nr:Ig-like domain-containing protein [Lachnospiraceae bacterium]
MSKKQKDQFSLTLTGVIIYSVILIGVVFGTYLFVKNIFEKSELRATEAAAKAYEEELEKEEAKEAEPVKEEEPKKEEKEPAEPVSSKEIDLSKVDVHSFVDNDKKINYSENFFGTGKRDINLTKDMDFFNRLENVKDPETAGVNDLSVKRFSAVNDRDNGLEFLVYSNVENGQPEKITARENCGDYYRITDYYYLNGRIKYADEYDQTVIYPVDISSSDITARYYINKDCLVEYVYCENDKATVYRLSELSQYSKGTADQYDYLEKDIINRAYVTYYACQNMSDDVTISGYVLDEFNQPLEGVNVEFYEKGNSNRAALTQTNGDGFYSFSAKAGSEADHYISLQKTSLEEVNIYGIKIPEGSGDIKPETVYMGYLDNKVRLHDVQIVVRNAVDTSVPVNEGQIKLRRGLNNRDGEVFYSGTLDFTGSLFVQLYSSEYTAEVSKGGYETAYINLAVKQDHLAVIGYAVPDLPENSYVAVISWETAPLDLDSRLIGQYGNPLTRSVTDSIGSVMAESLGITDAGKKEYKVYLSDYGNAVTNNNMTYNLSDSGAVVDIYSYNGLETSFKVPAAHAGTVWDVCTIRNGAIIPDNNYYYILDEGSVFASK